VDERAAIILLVAGYRVAYLHCWKFICPHSLLPCCFFLVEISLFLLVLLVLLQPVSELFNLTCAPLHPLNQDFYSALLLQFHQFVVLLHLAKCLLHLYLQFSVLSHQKFDFLVFNCYLIEQLFGYLLEPFIILLVFVRIGCHLFNYLPQPLFDAFRLFSV